MLLRYSVYIPWMLLETGSWLEARWVVSLGSPRWASRHKLPVTIAHCIPKLFSLRLMGFTSHGWSGYSTSLFCIHTMLHQGGWKIWLGIMVTLVDFQTQITSFNPPLQTQTYSFVLLGPTSLSQVYPALHTVVGASCTPPKILINVIVIMGVILNKKIFVFYA